MTPKKVSHAGASHRSASREDETVPRGEELIGTVMETQLEVGSVSRDALPKHALNDQRENACHHCAERRLVGVLHVDERAS